MMKRFVPTYYVKHCTQIDFTMLKNQGINLVLFDVDNTLVAHKSQVVEDRVKKMIGEVYHLGMTPLLISNNTQKRVEKIAKELKIESFSFACKPSKRRYKQIIKKYDCKPQEIVAIGDQLITDVYGANRMGIKSILQDPLAEKENTAGKATRRLENKIWKRLLEKGWLKKGEYYHEM
ncbi:MAG: YqeG family HAD IIIA-type phosphatase [Anaerorhabdus sp.]